MNNLTLYRTGIDHRLADHLAGGVWADYGFPTTGSRGAGGLAGLGLFILA